MPTTYDEEDEDGDEDGEGEPLLSSSSDNGAGAPPSRRWCVSSLLLFLLLPLVFGAGVVAGGAHAQGGDAHAVLMRARLLWDATTAQAPRPLAPSLLLPMRSTRTALQPAPLPALGLLPDAREEAESAVGHEWAGGEVGGADQLLEHDRWGRHNVPPTNSSLLLLGILSGSRNFAQRDTLRRALWAQKPWRLGAAWRFVVGTRLPRGDNNRISLYYERTRCGDIDLVDQPEMAPLQALKPLSWLLRSARVRGAPGAPPPRWVGLTSDAVLPYIPRVLAALAGAERAATTASAKSADAPMAYAGSLGWSTWPKARGASAWACVRGDLGAADRRGSVYQRAAGMIPRPAGALSRRGRMRAAADARAAQCGVGGGAPPFPAAAEGLQLLTSSMLAQIETPLKDMLKYPAALEVTPPPALWKRALARPMAAEGRTPSGPAQLAAAAVANAIAQVLTPPPYLLLDQPRGHAR